MTMFAKIAPRDGVVAILDSQGSVRSARRLDGSVLPFPVAVSQRLHDFDTAVVPVQSPQHALQLLKKRAESSMCIDMVLMLFDDDISMPTRKRIAAELETLLSDADIRCHTEETLYARPLHQSANVEAAITATADSNVAAGFVRTLINAQNRVARLFDAWLITKDALLDPGDAERIYSCLSSNGVFRRLALEVTNRGELGAIKAGLIFTAGQNASRKIDPRDLQSYFTEIERSLPEGTTNRISLRHKSSGSLPVEKRPAGRVVEPIHKTDAQSFEATLKQVDVISDLYANGRDEQADGFLNELIDELGKYEDGDSFVVKSLCNIATKVGLRGRRDVSLRCHEKALSFPDGLDATLYLQLGQALSNRRKYSEAVECFQHARRLDTGALRDSISSAEIRARMEIGQYDQAIQQLKSLTFLDSSESDLTLLGKALRRTGLLQEATRVYQHILSFSAGSHQARAGLAEIQKQSGRPHRAIDEYNSIVSELEAVTENLSGSLRVYNLARGHLLRMTGQFDKSLAVLYRLLSVSNADQDANLQVAKTLWLKGDEVNRRKAEEHFSKANGQTLDTLAQLVFAKASGLMHARFVSEKIIDMQALVLPDEHGAYRCFSAFDLITNREFGRVGEVLAGTRFVDQPIADLAMVLKFHAEKKMGGSLTMKADHSLCRIAKRSDKALREALQAIESGNDNQAVASELEAFLRLVA